jgi:hypothetical protein
MRADGEYTFFRVQHEESSGRWVDSALDHLLFKGLPRAQAKGRTGDYYRALLRPYGASSALWQATGLNGFERIEDARPVLVAVRGENPDRRFRLVKITQTKATEVVA